MTGEKVEEESGQEGEARRWRSEDLQSAQKLQAGCSVTAYNDEKCDAGRRG